MTSRRGASLISTLVMISILSGLLLLVGTLLRGMMVAEVATASRVSQLRQWEQLMVQFRRDVHAATNAEIVASAEPLGQELQLSTPAGRIEYVCRAGAVERHQPAASRREVWRFPDQRTEVREQGDARWIVLEVTFPAAGLDDTLHPAARTPVLSITAELGRQERLGLATKEAP